MTDETVTDTPEPSGAETADAAAMALFANIDAGGAEPAAVEATETAPDTPETEPSDNPLGDLVGALLERKNKRAAEQPDPQVAQLQAELEAMKAAQSAPKVPAGMVSLEDVKAAIQRDPSAWLAQQGIDPKVHAKSVYEGIVSPQAASVRTALERQIGELTAKVEKLTESPGQVNPDVAAYLERQQQQDQTTARTKVQDDFMTLATSNGDDEKTLAFPLVAQMVDAKGLGRGYVLRRAYGVIEHCRDQGVEPNNDGEILAALERQLAIEQRAHGPAETGAGTRRSRQGTSTLTNDLASSGTARSASTTEEREAIALRLFQSMDSTG